MRDRVFLPGSEWFYAKLYTAPELLTDLAARHLPSAMDHLFALPRSSADSTTQRPAGDGSAVPRRTGEQTPQRDTVWFFTRYGDPEEHLRLRIRLSTPERWAETLDALNVWGAKLLDANLVSRVELGTYEQETHRYGGPLNVEQAERVFGADSADSIALLGGPYRGADVAEQMGARVASMWAATGDDDVVAAASDGAMVIAKHTATYAQKKNSAYLHQAGLPDRATGRAYPRIGSYFGSLRASGVSARRRVYIAASLGHMHLNRCGASAETERIVVDAATTALRAGTRSR